MLGNIVAQECSGYSAIDQDIKNHLAAQPEWANPVSQDAIGAPTSEEEEEKKVHWGEPEK